MIHELDIVPRWIKSNDVVDRLVREAQRPQTILQLALISLALVNCLRLVTTDSEKSHGPQTGSYVSDLDALLHGCHLENDLDVAVQVTVALIVRLRWLGRFEVLTTILEDAFEGELPLTADTGCLSYIGMRTDNADHDVESVVDHDTAFNAIMIGGSYPWRQEGWELVSSV